MADAPTMLDSHNAAEQTELMRMKEQEAAFMDRTLATFWTPTMLADPHHRDLRIVLVPPPRIFPNSQYRHCPHDRLLSLPQPALVRIYAYILPTKRTLRLLPATHRSRNHRHDKSTHQPRRVNTALFRLSWFSRITAHHFLIRHNTIVLTPNAHAVPAVFPSPRDFGTWVRGNVYNGAFIPCSLRFEDFAANLKPSFTPPTSTGYAGKYSNDYGRGRCFADETKEDEEDVASYEEPGMALMEVYALLAQCPGVRKVEIQLQAFMFLDRRGPDIYWRRDPQREIIQRYELYRLWSSAAAGGAPLLQALAQLVFVVYVPPAFHAVPRMNVALVVEEFRELVRRGFEEASGAGAGGKGKGRKVRVGVGIREDRDVSVGIVGREKEGEKVTFSHPWT